MGEYITSRYCGAGSYTLYLQQDGDVAEYTETSVKFWDATTQSSNPSYLKIEANGNLAAYTTSDVKYWSSSTKTIVDGLSTDSSYTLLQCDGNIITRDTDNTNFTASGQKATASFSDTLTSCCPSGTYAFGASCVGIKF